MWSEKALLRNDLTLALRMGGFPVNSKGGAVLAEYCIRTLGSRPRGQEKWNGFEEPKSGQCAKNLVYEGKKIP